MKKHFELYLPVINVLGIILVLWSLTIIKVNPERALIREALYDSTDNNQNYHAEMKENKFIYTKNMNKETYRMQKKNAKLVFNF